MTAWTRLAALPVEKLAAVPPGALAIVRGTVVELGGEPIAPPVALPPGATPLPRIAVAQFAVEEMPRFQRPLRELHERVRPLVLRDATGRAFVRVADEERGDLQLRIAAPFVAGKDGARDVYLRTIALGEELVAVGRVRFELDAAGFGGGYREPARVAVVEAVAIFDGAAWESREAWRRLPWHRKLSLIVRNR